eukprot:TRINITY_DN6527_c0_g1_i1.p1 TRINITY_DN6527_c0_g1~~TRINITY_DN6527_c0_g1_i1.p1  ORF type:complete len:174 (+),score=18.64 TRINITY_DN6527_c0_g1_i1:433-954(+)
MLGHSFRRLQKHDCANSHHSGVRCTRGGHLDDVHWYTRQRECRYLFRLRYTGGRSGRRVALLARDPGSRGVACILLKCATDINSIENKSDKQALQSILKADCVAARSEMCICSDRQGTPSCAELNAHHHDVGLCSGCNPGLVEALQADFDPTCFDIDSDSDEDDQDKPESLPD